MPRLRALLLALLVGLCFGDAARAGGPPSVDTPVRLQGGGSRDAAVVIGNEAYQALPQATYAGVDARAARDTLMNGLGISKSRTSFYENASGGQITDAVKRGVGRVKRGGTLWIYFAGYGTVSGGARALLGVDAAPDSIGNGGVTLDSLIVLTSRSKASRVIYIVDAGFGGVGRDGLPLVAGGKAAAPTLAQSSPANTAIWLADDGSRTVGGYADGRHGLFTWLALGAMRGWADGALPGTDRDGKVSLAEAQYYASWTGRRMGRPMLPTEESNPDKASWVLTLDVSEKGPSDETLNDLATADRARRFAIAEERLKAEAGAFWQQTSALAAAGGPEGRQALQAFVDQYSMPVLNIEWLVYLPEVRQAEQALASYGKNAPPVADNSSTTPSGNNGSTTPSGNNSSTTPAGNNGSTTPSGNNGSTTPSGNNGSTTPHAIITTAVSCDDLVALEGVAMLGQFTPDQVSCLQGKLATTRVQTTKNKISRLLLVNAQTKGDIPQWEVLMRRHLEEIDRSDPNLCMTYAIYLHKKGVEHDDEVIYWASYALENKQVWVGDEYVKRVYSLLRLKAEAANALWTASEKAYQADATDDNDATAKEYRGQAKDFSREWLDYARASGQDSKAALELCRSASGSDAFCQTK